MSQQDERFFGRQLAQSKIKAEIVDKYFGAWARIAINKYSKVLHRPVFYLDLFSGPGRYDDGNESTPLMIARRVLDDPDLRSWVQLMFNDAKASHIASLERAISGISDSMELRYKPRFSTHQVGPDTVALFREDLPPTFTFLDPLGYRMISRELIAKSVNSQLCDGLFFFNYLYVNRALSNPVLLKSTFSLFGDARACELASAVAGRTPIEREALIISSLSDALEELGVPYPLFFRVLHRSMERPSHHLVFVSTHPLAHAIMKDILATYSVDIDEGVPNYEYQPPAERKRVPIEVSPSAVQLGLAIPDPMPSESRLSGDFDLQPLGKLDALMEEIVNRFNDRTMTVAEVFQEHQFGTPYIKANYKSALSRLEAAGRVLIDPPAARRRMRLGVRTLADEASVAISNGMRE